MNQSAAYSDFHGTGANPAANASYTDGAYVASRFRIVQSRRHVDSRQLAGVVRDRMPRSTAVTGRFVTDYPGRRG